ncbi:MAG: glycosyltransferase family 39 protein [Armatimonadota bacterium]|nr:glycosyltransferase family 39 protein [bacterium]
MNLFRWRKRRINVHTLFSLLLSVLMLACAACVGRGLRRLLQAEGSASERLVVDSALGLGVVSLVIFAAAALQLLHVLPVILLIILALGCISLPQVARDAVHVARRLIRYSSASSLLIGLLLLILGVAALIPALAPPSMSDWDSLAYHLAVPKLYINHGGIYYINFSSHSNFPFLMEMLYTAMLRMGSMVAAKMINYWVGVLLVASVAMLVRRHFNPKAAPMAAVALTGIPIVLWLSTTAYIDLATGLYTVLAVHLLLNYLEKPERGYLIGSAIAAGLAASTKMTGLAVIPLIVIWLVVDRFASEKRVFEWKRGLMFTGIALLMCSPWYIKSIIYTGNPVYPFFYSIFGGRDWTADLARNYSMLQAKFGMGHDFTAFLMLPFNLTFFSDKFYDTPGLYIGPILLVSLPLLFIARYKSRKLLGLAAFFVAQVVVWFALSQQSRYLVPSFGILAVLIAVIAYQDDRFKLARAALWFVCIDTAIFGLYTLLPAAATSAPVVFGRQTQDEYLSHSLDVYSAQQWMNENLPKDAKVAFFGDTRGFYLDRDYIWADPGHNTIFTRTFKSELELISNLKSQRITHLMINFRVFPERGKGGELTYQAIDKGDMEQVYPEGDAFASVSVYKIR